jgi:hypothetical protein
MAAAPVLSTEWKRRGESRVPRIEDVYGAHDKKLLDIRNDASLTFV